MFSHREWGNTKQRPSAWWDDNATFDHRGLTWFAGNHSQRILQGCDLFNWKNKGGRLILRQNKNKINKRYLGGWVIGINI
ncbi:hypothetical protein TWF128_000656 [Orbilia oligospora]|nr:hypothetical protein TWF128_000656 [Orbilia oligospora]